MRPGGGDTRGRHVDHRVGACAEWACGGGGLSARLLAGLDGQGRLLRALAWLLPRDLGLATWLAAAACGTGSARRVAAAGRRRSITCIVHRGDALCPLASTPQEPVDHPSRNAHPFTTLATAVALAAGLALLSLASAQTTRTSTAEQDAAFAAAASEYRSQHFAGAYGRFMSLADQGNTRPKRPGSPGPCTAMARPCSAPSGMPRRSSCAHGPGW